MHVAAQGVKCALAAVHLHGLVEGKASLYRHVVIAEEHKVPHETSRSELRHGRLTGDELGKMCLPVMIKVVRMEVVVRLARKGCLVLRALATLQNVVDIETDVVDLRKPLRWHVLREHAGVTTCLGQVEHHVLHKRAAVEIIVLKGWPLVQQLVVLARRAAAVECLPLLLELCLLLCIVLLALRVFNCAAQVIVVEVVFLDEGLPVLVGVQPLRLRQQRDRRVLEGDPECPRTVCQYVLRLGNGLLAALCGGIEELPSPLLPLDCSKVVLGEHGSQQRALLAVEVLEALEDLLVADLGLPCGPVNRLGGGRCGPHELRDGTISGTQQSELLLVRLAKCVLLQRVPLVARWQSPSDATAQHFGDQRAWPSRMMGSSG
mmetsp:Transcript_6637/g.15124  ORF Transcript_6637/g.15124 Transcript_6637/m.15124 type:complete len:376 (-) Transcript_6637:30-1157(-)